MTSLWKIWLQRKDRSLLRMMIECSVVVQLLQDCTKERRSGCVHYSLYSRVITFCESIMWSGGKHKSHAPLDLQKVWFGWPKTQCDAATDGWSNSEKAYRDTPWCASKSGVIHISADFVILDCEVDFEVPTKVTPMPRPPPLSSKISEKDQGW